jgi:hypothetical protein
MMQQGRTRRLEVVDIYEAVLRLSILIRRWESATETIDVNEHFVLAQLLYHWTFDTFL